MGRLTLTIFYDPKAKDTLAMVERMKAVGPSLHIGVAWIDITSDPELTKRYAKTAPVGTIAGTLIFAGDFDEQGLRKWVKRLQKR